MRIVLVDPSRAVQRAMTGLIAPDQHDVLSFCAGHDALECVRTDANVRVLITSVQLPDISGIQLCAAARKLAGSRRALFIIVMSSTDDYGLVIRALDNGADDFVRKPPFPEELRARLRSADRLTSMQDELIKYATTDVLTGLLNRRAFFAEAAEACRTENATTLLSAVMFDVDHFKGVSDSHGHEAGDRVLASVGAAAKMVTDGIIGRLGGEEFCLLERCDLGDAVELAENLRRSISNLRYPEWKLGRVTCSFGVAEWENGDTIDRLLRRADMALYEAKNIGRDRVITADSFTPTAGHDGWRGVARAARRSRQ